MLILARRINERIRIGTLVITVVEISKGEVRIGVAAQPGTLIERLPPECPNHTEHYCCPECPGHAATDGQGFPHPSEAKKRKVLRRCSQCQRMIGPHWWTHDIAGARFGCRDCYP